MGQGGPLTCRPSTACSTGRSFSDKGTSKAWLEGQGGGKVLLHSPAGAPKWLEPAGPIQVGVRPKQSCQPCHPSP